MRAAHALPGPTAPQSGFVLDGFGGLHPYGAPGLAETPGAGHYWKGWDIARDFAFLPDGTGGLVLDGYGGLHPFGVNGNGGPVATQGGAYFGRDVARKVVIFSDGSGGYVLDMSGGIHPFGINGPPPVSASSLATTGSWPGANIARDIVLIPGDGLHSGYVLDLSGGVHPFHPTTDGSTMPATLTGIPYWSGKDLARTIWFLPGSTTAGYLLDAWGGQHPFGGAARIVNYPYWPNTNLAVSSWGA